MKKEEEKKKKKRLEYPSKVLYVLIELFVKRSTYIFMKREKKSGPLMKGLCGGFCARAWCEKESKAITKFYLPSFMYTFSDDEMN